MDKGYIVTLIIDNDVRNIIKNIIFTKFNNTSKIK